MSESIFDYYNQAIETLDRKVEQLQEASRQHLHCQKGCSSCCENVHFRITYIEAVKLFEGFVHLPMAQKQAVLENIEQQSPDCPFLLDKSCSLYAYRPALCRAYGILIQVGEKLATCKLNFTELKENESIQKLDMLPYYDFLNDLSLTLWETTARMAHASGQSEPEPPKISIREFMEMLLSPKWQGVMRDSAHENSSV